MLTGKINFSLRRKGNYLNIEKLWSMSPNSLIFRSSMKVKFKVCTYLMYLQEASVTC